MMVCHFQSTQDTIYISASQLLYVTACPPFSLAWLSTLSSNSARNCLFFLQQHFIAAYLAQNPLLDWRWEATLGARGVRERYSIWAAKVWLYG
jgi:hypothetical protein